MVGNIQVAEAIEGAAWHGVPGSLLCELQGIFFSLLWAKLHGLPHPDYPCCLPWRPGETSKIHPDFLQIMVIQATFTPILPHITPILP